MTQIRELVCKSWRYFAWLTAAAFALRLYFILKHPTVAGDALFYGDLAKNWLIHGVLGTTDLTGVTPCIIRLPGYPAFLAAVWSVFGMEHYRPVLMVQMLVDVVTCFAVSDLVLRLLHSERAARIAFLLAALCPFTANYAACALTETLSIFFAVLAFDLALMALNSGQLRHWAYCGGAVGAGILLRPDGGIVLAVIATYVLLRRIGPIRNRVLAVVVLSAAALAPLVPWTIRNWHTFHVFQPLAPRYANAPDQPPPHGYQRWVKTWMADYVSVAEIYWVEGSEPLDINNLPSRAFDTPEERLQIEAIFNQYNTGDKSITPELDRRFGELAQRRIQRNPVRYYLWLPAMRIADMWLRPRTEMLELNSRWWQIQEDRRDSLISIGLGILNLLYVGAALWAGICWLFRKTLAPQHWWLLAGFMVVRSLFLGSIENPEPRYTLECFPLIIAFAAATLAGITREQKQGAAAVSSTVSA